jgi:hypothetical protein
MRYWLIEGVIISPAKVLISSTKIGKWGNMSTGTFDRFWVFGFVANFHTHTMCFPCSFQAPGFVGR